MLLFDYRTKWKRQAIVSYEMIAEAGNLAAFQHLYSAASIPSHPYQLENYKPPLWIYNTNVAPTPMAGLTRHAAQNDLLYRQAAAVTLQKPMPYRLYPPAAMMLAGPSAPLGNLSAGSALGGYYSSRDSPVSAELLEQQQQQQRAAELLQRERSKSLERTPPPPTSSSSQGHRESPDTPTSGVGKQDSDDESINDV